MSGSFAQYARRGRALLAVSAGVLLIFSSGHAAAASDNCLSVQGIANKLQSPIVSTNYSGVLDPVTGITTFTYFFTGYDGNALPVADGVPGLISYCVYPAAGNLPNSIAVDPTATGWNGDLFVAKIAAKGSFSFTRANGNPSNIPLDGASRTMGTATWNGKCVTDNSQDPPVTTCAPTAAASQTVLLHINDPTECTRLYGDGTSTCWVFPTNGQSGPPPLCNGEPACKSALIDEASGAFDSNGYPIVPMNTLLHIHYTYIIVNQPTNTYNMIFYPPGPSTKDVNSGGGKDYFGCEQNPDPNGAPGAWGTYSPYQSTGFKLTFFSSPGGQCPQSRFTFVDPGPNPITLTPGQSVTFTVDMTTRVNKGGKQEFTSSGPHLLNSGFTVKWFQSDDGLMHSFTTGITPLYVNAQP